jgi:hypothetical protein
MRYQKYIRRSLICLLALAWVAILPQASQETPPKAQLPLLNTSAGQSQDVTTVNIICEEAGILYDYCDVPNVDLISSGVGLAGREGESRSGFHVEVYTDTDTFPKGTAYKTVIFAIGASLKGMGASGLTVNDEVARLEKLVTWCKQNEVFVIAVHVGGVSRRGTPGSDNERVIEAVAPFADYIIVTKDSNKDSRFSKIAQEKGIPITEVDYALNLVDILSQVFSSSE